MVTFAIVPAAIIPTVRRSFEIHALGCRDLKKMGPLAAEWVIDAENGEEALNAAIEQLKGRGETEFAEPSKFFTQSCCSLRRCAAAGRIFTPKSVEEVPADLDVPATGELGPEVDVPELTGDELETILAESAELDAEEDAAGFEG